MSNSRIKIIIADDEPQIIKPLAEILEYECYTVEQTDNGLDVLKKIRNKDYDLVILDIKMPTMDGVEALERITKQKPYIPVIMISGLGGTDTANFTMEVGAKAFLHKPIDLYEFLAAVKNVVE